MNGNKLTILLTLCTFIVLFVCIPAAAQTIDSDGDGVPDEVEDAIPSLFGDKHSSLSNVATFPSAEGRYMTLLTDSPGLELKNVEAIDSPGIPRSLQAAEAAPFGFVKFGVGGISFNHSEFFALILHGFEFEADDPIDMIRYGSRACPSDPDNAEYYPVEAKIDVFPGIGTRLVFPLFDAAPESSCDLSGIITYIGAPAFESRLDADDDGVIVFADICPIDPENDADSDGICEVEDVCPADPDNDADGDGICGDVDNCPAVSNINQLDANYNGTGDQCEVEEETTVYSYLGKRFWRFFRDHDVWEIYAKSGESVILTLEANPKNRGRGKKINLILFSKTRGARLLRIDRSALDPKNRIEVQIPKDGKYGIVVGESFWWGHRKRYKGEYRLTVRASQETLDSLRATRSVGKWWQ